MFTMGDYVYEIVHAMSYYDGFGADVLIVAFHKIRYSACFSRSGRSIPELALLVF